MQEDSFKRKNILVVVFEILVIALGVGGITFATSKLMNSQTKTTLKIGEYNVDYLGENKITATNLEPISDDLININTTENVARLEFSLKGVSTNKDENLIYDIMLDELNIDCSLLNEYTKWRLYKNNELLSSGNFSPSFDGNILSDNYRLTTIQEDLPSSNSAYDNYVFLIWISESCDDLTTCKLIDQSNTLNSNMSIELFIALYSGEKLSYTRIPSNDTSCANKPELYDNMIPITYSNGSFIVADENSNWYNYSNSEWANAVVTKKEYQVGEVIDNADILAYYVWIPRFRYKLWNSLENTYNALDNGIEIIFEGGTRSISNDEYITHPAFENNLKGFWISKYEISQSEEYKFIPNTESYTNDTLENYQNIMSSLSTNYALGDNINTHLVTNKEWGATLYLSHSKYGVCSGDGCQTIGMNETYISGSNKQDTTTRNVYGVYDMNGSSSEYVTGYNEVGSANSEIILENSTGWYDSYITNTERGYFLRAGINNNLFSQLDVSMSNTKYSARSTITKEAND